MRLFLGRRATASPTISSFATHFFVSRVSCAVYTFLLLSGLFAVSLRADDAGKKLPIPDASLPRPRRCALVLDIFKDDIQDAKDAEAKARLALNLLQQGKEQSDDAANRYVLTS